MDDADDPILQRRLQLLGDLAELGLDVARAVAARAQEPDADVEAVARAYARVSRAVRLAVMLQSKAMQDRRDHRARADKALADAADLQARSEPLYIHKARVERIVERIAQEQHGPDEDEVDRLVFEAGERLDDEDLYGDILDRPIAELVALICRDLGLDPDWARLKEEAWMQDDETTRPPPQSGGGGPRRGGGGMPHPPDFKSCAPKPLPSSAPDG